MTEELPGLVARLHAFEAKHPEKGRRLWRTVDAVAESCVSERDGNGPLEIPCSERDETLHGADAWHDHVQSEHLR